MKRSRLAMESTVRRIEVVALTDDEIDRRNLPRVVARDRVAEAPLAPIDVNGKFVPSDVTCKVLRCVVQSDWHVHARLKTFMALARVCQGLRLACQHAMYLPEHVAFRREARDWDKPLLKRLYPTYLGRYTLLDWRWGPDLHLARTDNAEPPVFVWRVSQPHLCRLDHLDELTELDLDDLGPGEVSILLRRLGDTKLPALRVLKVGEHCTRREEQDMIAKCPSLTTLHGNALPLVKPASVEVLHLAFFNSSGLDSKAWAAEASGLRELRIQKLEDDSAQLLKLLAPQLRVLHICDLRALLSNTLADLVPMSLLELGLPMARVPGPDYAALRTVPTLLGRLPALTVRLWLTDTQKDDQYFSDTLKLLASMRGLQLFALELRGTPLKDNYRNALGSSLLEALRANPDLLELKVTMNGKALRDPSWTRRAVENRCYAPR